MTRRRSSTRTTRSLDPDEVLSGRVKPTLDGLLDLIHRVNPTGRDRHPCEERARYLLKARLQSLLVRRFADELDVEPHASAEGIVSLGRRDHVREGCHAVLMTLDDDARSWINFQLDIAKSQSKSSAKNEAKAVDFTPASEPPEDASADEPPASDEPAARTPKRSRSRGRGRSRGGAARHRRGVETR